MLAGAIADVTIALLAVLLPAWLAPYVTPDASSPALALQFWPLGHLVFPCFCIMAWRDPKRNVIIVAGAIVGRTIYALYVGAVTLALGLGVAWLLDGGISLALAITHYVFLRRSDFGLWEVVSRAGNPPGLGE
jgi:hypothetical protein